LPLGHGYENSGRGIFGVRGRPLLAAGRVVAPRAATHMTLTSAARGSGLEFVMDASRVVSEPQTLAKYAIHGIAPGSAAKPRSAQEAAKVVRLAATAKLAVIPCGNRTKLDLGSPPLRYDIALDLSGLRELAHYDPRDLTLSVD